MKKALFSVLVLIAALTSCSKEQQNPAQGKNEDVKMVPVTFTAGVSTKTHLGSDGKSVIWQANDQISIFANGNNYQFTLESGANTSSATFSGEMSETDAAASEFYALYPYDATATIADGVITAKGVSNNINYNQWGSFPNKVVQSVAKSEGSNFDFKLVCALLTVTVPEDMHGLLKNIMISANAGASTEAFIGGTVAITVGDEPSVAVSGGSADIMVQNASGIDKATYYFPVYPKTFTKGLRVKMSYVDNRTPEYLFNGSSITVARAHKVNVGTLKPQPTFVVDDFESYNVMESGAAEIKYKDNSYIKGNTGALKVVENPFKTATNNSSKVLVDDMHTASWSTSGYVQLYFSSTPWKERFPYAARDKFKAIRFKAYIGSSEYCPCLRFPVGGGSGNKMPSKVNGVETSQNGETYAANLKHDDWNVLEFNLAACGYSSPYASNFGSLDSAQISVFYTSAMANSAAAISETNAKIVYFDDIEFLYN